jgi:hypothetical protein
MGPSGQVLVMLLFVCVLQGMCMPAFRARLAAAHIHKLFAMHAACMRTRGVLGLSLDTLESGDVALCAMVCYPEADYAYCEVARSS